MVERGPRVVRAPRFAEPGEARVSRWFKRPGDAVERDEPVIELEAVQATIVVQAPVRGVIAWICEAVEVGADEPLFALDPPRPVEVRVPLFDGEVREYEIGRFLKRPGDSVARDEAVVELEDAKVVLELTAAESGVITAITAATSVRSGEVLYSLQVEEAAEAPAPWLTALQQPWDAGHVRTRARELAPKDVPRAEAALIWTALVRALAAVPMLHARVVGAGREVRIDHCELEPGRAGWSHVSQGTGDSPALALARGRAGRDAAAKVEVIRIGSPGPQIAAAGQSAVKGLVVTIGAVREEAVVEDGAIVARPRAMLAIQVAEGLPGDQLLAFAAALAEQLAAV